MKEKVFFTILRGFLTVEYKIVVDITFKMQYSKVGRGKGRGIRNPSFVPSYPTPTKLNVK